ncbi:MAG: zinc ribbon domain-containing protein, partial [Rubrobacter sp.]|nr:zinc ribbon domain-containing protein [Rubrobacter sp.]
MGGFASVERSFMYCPNCNAYNDDNATRCTNCGNLLQKIETPRVDVPPPPPEARGGVFAPPAASGGAIPDLPNYLVQAVVLTVVIPFRSIDVIEPPP